MEFKQFRRKQIAELRPYKQDEILPLSVSISAADIGKGSPRVGDMIARNPKNHDDQWLVAAKYFADNFEPMEETKEMNCEQCGKPFEICPHGPDKQDYFSMWFNRLLETSFSDFEKRVLWAGRDKLRELYFIGFNERNDTDDR